MKYDKITYTKLKWKIYNLQSEDLRIQRKYDIDSRKYKNNDNKYDKCNIRNAL